MSKESDTAVILITCPAEPSKVQNASPASPSSPLTAVSISNAPTGAARTATSYGPVSPSSADTRTRYRPAVGKTASRGELLLRPRPRSPSSSMVNSRPSGEKSPTTVSKESDTAVILTTCPAPPSNCHHSADDSLNRPVAFERRFRASERRSLGSRTSSDGAPAPAVLSTTLRTNPSTEDAGARALEIPFAARSTLRRASATSRAGRAWSISACAEPLVSPPLRDDGAGDRTDCSARNATAPTASAADPTSTTADPTALSTASSTALSAASSSTSSSRRSSSSSESGRGRLSTREITTAAPRITIATAPMRSGIADRNA